MRKIHIELTDEAREKLEKVSDSETAFQLVYDSEGCGCAVSGVPQLTQISKTDTTGLQNAGDKRLPLYIEPRHIVFFEPQLKLDYDRSKDSFRLTSDQQIYNHDMRLIRKR